MEVDIVLRDVRRWTQNLYLSEDLRRKDESGDLRIRKFGQLFIEIGGMIDTEYIKYRKQFSLRKKFVRFMKYKFGQITNETQNKLKSLKSGNKQNANTDDKNTKQKEKENRKHKHKKRKKKRKKRRKHNVENQEMIPFHPYQREPDQPAHVRCHTIDVNIMKQLSHDQTLELNLNNNQSNPTFRMKPLKQNKSAELQ